MQAKYRRDLYNIAKEQVMFHMEKRSEYAPFANTKQFLGMQIWHLAATVLPDSSIDDEEILPVFFDKDAVSVILNLPNRYWFWRTVFEMLGGEGGFIGRGKDLPPFSVQQLKDVFGSMRSAVADRYDFTDKDEELFMTPVQQAMAAVDGVLLIKSERNGGKLDYDLVPNQIFSAEPIESLLDPRTAEANAAATSGK